MVTARSRDPHPRGTRTCPRSASTLDRSATVSRARGQSAPGGSRGEPDMVQLPRTDVPGRTPGQPRPPTTGTQTPPDREHPGSGYSTFVEDGFSGWAWFTGVLMG